MHLSPIWSFQWPLSTYWISQLRQPLHGSLAWFFFFFLFHIYIPYIYCTYNTEMVTSTIARLTHTCYWLQPPTYQDILASICWQLHLIKEKPIGTIQQRHKESRAKRGQRGEKGARSTMRAVGQSARKLYWVKERIGQCPMDSRNLYWLL